MEKVKGKTWLENYAEKFASVTTRIEDKPASKRQVFKLQKEKKAKQ